MSPTQKTDQMTRTDPSQDSDRQPAGTVYHIDRDSFEEDRGYANMRSDVRNSQVEIDKEIFEEHYIPVETVLDEDDPESVFERSQGFRVNTQCNARHGVSSSQVGDIFEMIDSDGTTTFYIVDRFGFTELQL